VRVFGKRPLRFGTVVFATEQTDRRKISGRGFASTCCPGGAMDQQAIREAHDFDGSVEVAAVAAVVHSWIQKLFPPNQRVNFLNPYVHALGGGGGKGVVRDRKAQSAAC